jgi:electron transport complex protein RnfB
MSIEDNMIYEELRRQIDKMPVGMPKTETGEEIRILKYLFTPEEAQVALFLNMVFESCAKIYRRAKKVTPLYSCEEIEGILKKLAAKGAILWRVHKGKSEFSYAQFVIGMFELQVDRMTKGFARDSFAYTRGGFAEELHRTKLPQLRAIPINKQIVNEQHIGIYDNIRELVRKTDGEFGLMNCICRQRKDLIGKKCEVTDLRQTCITFPHTTPLFQSFGTNIPVSKEKILDILEHAEKEGLVIQLGNSQVPMVICCCCGDCCEILVSAKRFPRPAELFTTNYYAKIDAQKCSGCMNCVKRCQMNAPVIASEGSYIDLSRCIGCSICVSACPRQAIILQKKKKSFVPPKNETALFTKIFYKKMGFFKTLKAGIKLLLGKKV